jgi:hypothetical protein
LTRRLDHLERKVIKQQKRDIDNLRKENINADVYIDDEVAAGAASHIVFNMDAVSHAYDELITGMMVWVENAPGGGKTITVTATNGTDTMNVVISGAAETFDKNTDDKFYWRSRSQNLTVDYDSTAGTAIGHITIHLQKHQVREWGRRH